MGDQDEPGQYAERGQAHTVCSSMKQKLSLAPRLLVIAPNWIGDAVMAQPLLQLLRQQQPDAIIDVLAPAWVAPVLRAMAEVNEIIQTPFQHGALQLKERWRFAQQLRARGYSAAYVLPNTIKFALIPWMAGIPLRVGYRGESRYGLINRMHFDDKLQPRPMVPFYAALAFPPAPELPAQLPKPKLTLDTERIAAVLAELKLDASQSIIVMAPGAEFGPAKRWPEQHFATLAQQIQQSDKEAQIVLLGSGKDVEVCNRIAALAPQVKQLAGKTSLYQAVALIAAATAVVSNDSGLLHIASAFNRPVLAIYGPTDPDHAPPFSSVAHSFSLRLDCAPCRQRVCPLGHQDCMQKLLPAQVWQPLQQILQSGSAHD
jgi:heptosyltransferase-2